MATDLLERLIRALRVLPPPNEVTLYLSLRPQAQWLRSLHSHLALKDVRLRDDLAQFSARFPGTITDEVPRIAAALPGLRILTRDIATLAQAPFGIAQPFVDFLDLPPDDLARLVPPGHVYRSADPALVDQLIDLNRSRLDAEALRAAKQQLIRGNELAGTDRQGKPR